MADFEQISPYIYGTTRLGDDSIAPHTRIAMATKAMESGVWFHTSSQYGSAEAILKEAFAAGSTQVPHLIVKMGGNSVEEMLADARSNMKNLGVNSITVGQLCMWDACAEDFARGGACVDELHALKQTGEISHFVLEVFPWTSKLPLQALQAGYCDGLIDAFIFYLNPLQRFAANELWDEITKRNYPVISMRTIGGGDVHALRDVPGAAWVPYLQERATEVAPIFEQSGVKSWTEFCVRFAHSFPNVVATVGSSSKPERFDEFIAAANDMIPLPEATMQAIEKLQYRWSDAVDIHAEPWTM